MGRCPPPRAAATARWPRRRSKTADGDYTLAYAGLGPLTNFSTATSADGGRTLVGSPVSESFPGVDRQWITFLDDKTAILTYNGTSPRGKTVQISTDGGLTYGPSFVATSDGGRIGQIRSFLPAGKTNRVTESIVYIPYSNGNNVKMAISTAGGVSGTGGTCTILNAGRSPDAGLRLRRPRRRGQHLLRLLGEGRRPRRLRRAGARRPCSRPARATST